MIGTKLGPYEIVNEIGKGGMATVYVAHHAPMDRFVAVKVLRQSFAGDADAMARFQREARLVARLEHPHLLPIYDFDGTHDPPYIVMRFLESGTLKDLLARGRPPLQEISHLLQQVSSALDYAHRRGVIHRDIKPSNIMVDTDGNAFLADFGLARSLETERPGGSGGLTLPGTVLGTPGYMAPEQAVGQSRIDARADIYSLGVVLFELVTGEPPYRGENPVSVAMAHVNQSVPRPTALDGSLPPAIDGVIATAMAKAPKDRYSSAIDLAKAAEEALGRLTSATPPALAHAATETLVLHLKEREDREAGRRLADSSVGGPVASDSQSTPTGHSKQVSVLFANWAEYAESIEADDPESAKAGLEELWRSLEKEIRTCGGRIQERTADSALVVWGVEAAREDDPERAVRASLAMRETIREFAGASYEEVPMQAGITTGSVLLAPKEGSGELEVSGAAISLARRLERGAPHGQLIISQDTYRHVHGVFELSPGSPIRVRERRRPLDTYLVKGAAAARSDVGLRGETLFHGAELEQMREAFRDTVGGGKARLVTIVGQRGLGKTRLLSDFNEWMAGQGAGFRIFTARATPETAHEPWALLRVLFRVIFGVRAGEAPASLHEQLERGIVSLADPASAAGLAQTAAFIEQMLGAGSGMGEGLTMSWSRPLDQTACDRVSHHLERFLLNVARRMPMVIELKDLHWADEASLGAIAQVVRDNPRLPLLCLCLARPDLFDRLPAWGREIPHASRIDLFPLSRSESAALVEEILKEVPDLPAILRDLIVERAEGNPYYIEELVKVLLEDGVIIAGEPYWRVELARLDELHVPSTLTGLIQARLDGLPVEERTVLQRAAISGRSFWDGVLSSLDSADGVSADVPSAIDALMRRDLVYPRETSTFVGTREYSFGSSILREVVLDSIPKSLQRGYHARVAAWLADRTEDRPSEHAALIARHFELGGEMARAASFYQAAGDHAIRISSFTDAKSFHTRALEIMPLDGQTAASEVSIRLGLGEANWHLGENAEAQDHLSVALEMARAGADPVRQAEALYLLAQVAVRQGVLDLARSYLEESLEVSRLEDTAAQAKALYGLGDVAWRQQEYEEARGHLEAGLVMAREIGDQDLELFCLNRLGSVAQSLGDFQNAQGHLEECRALALDTANRERLAAVLNSLGEVLKQRGELGEAKAHFQESLALARAVGLHMACVGALMNLGFVTAQMGQTADSEEHFTEVLRDAFASSEMGFVLRALAGFAWLKHLSGDREGALGLLGLVLKHPFSDAGVHECALPVVEVLQRDADADDFARGLEAGLALDLDEVVSELLCGMPGE